MKPPPLSIAPTVLAASAALCLAAAGADVASSEPPRIDHVGLVAPDIIGITVLAGRVEYGRQVPYVRQEGDTVAEKEVHRFVARGGKVIGSLVGKEGDLLCTMDAVIGDRLDTAWADRPESYRIGSDDDPRYATPRPPTAVHRKTKPSDLAMVGPYRFDSPTETVVYLRLPAPLEAGSRYRISFEGSPLPAQELFIDATKLRSEAVHVSQLGFRPDDPAKVAFLSSWLGSGGALTYEAGLPFSVIDDATGATVLEGKTVLSKAARDRSEDAWGKNYNGTDVFLMDFTGLSAPGRYRVSVGGIGCSYPFEISEDAWRRAFVVAARGFYHQRSGIALGPPWTTYTRPRTFHPDDGLVVLASTAPLMDTGNGLNKKDSNFGNLVKGKTDRVVEDAWGGYMDAGDWDRRVQHLRVALLLLELAELFPEYFATLSLRIPESGGRLPDIVEESLFGIDFFRRMQLPDGGIRGGIESSEHPRRGEASFQESLEVMAYAPDVLSSYMYAGVTARAAGWLTSRAAGRTDDRAASYRDSALRAMEWAERNREPQERVYESARHAAVRDVRNYAAAEMLRLTGDGRWADVFLSTTAFKTGPAAAALHWDSLDQTDAAWVYARTEGRGVDARVRQHCLESVLRVADERIASVERTGFRWAKHPYAPVIYGALSSPEAAVNVVRAHALTGDAKYLRAAVLACQTGAGANPVNLCYTTGLGRRSPKHPLQIDHRITGQPPPPGLTVGGPLDSGIPGLEDPFIGSFAGAVFHPPHKEWPTLEAFWDVFWDPFVCEYTVHKPMAGTAYVWGYLAARRTRES